MSFLTGPASALGLATYCEGTLLDAWFPSPALGSEPTPVAGLEAATRTDDIRGVQVRPIRTVIDDLSAAPADGADAYLRLHLLSHRLAAPRTLNLDGIFGLLPLNAWTSLGPVALDASVDHH